MVFNRNSKTRRGVNRGPWRFEDYKGNSSGSGIRGIEWCSGGYFGVGWKRGHGIVEFLPELPPEFSVKDSPEDPPEDADGCEQGLQKLRMKRERGEPKGLALGAWKRKNHFRKMGIFSDSCFLRMCFLPLSGCNFSRIDCLGELFTGATGVYFRRRMEDTGGRL